VDSEGGWWNASPVSDPIQKLIGNVAEVNRLLEIHKQLAGNSPGRKHKVEVLNKSAIVLLVACWESFIEDLAGAAFEAMMTSAADPSVFPNDVLTLSSKALRTDSDTRKVWRLAGIGWKTVLADHKTEILKEYVGKLNTPKPKQIDGLFSSLTGISSLSATWTWHKSSAAQAVEKLTKLVELRGSIAHRVAASSAVHKSTVSSYVEFVYRLSVVSSNQVRTFVHARTKAHPWNHYYFKNTK